MRKYELLLVLPGTLNETEAQARAEEILALVKNHSASAEINVLGKNRLAYPVKQIRYGYFYAIVFEAEVDGLKELQTKLALLRDLLRTMITYFNTNLTAAQKIMYSTDELGVTTMLERPDRPVGRPFKKVETGGPAESAAPIKPIEEKSAPINIDEITKRLDDIIGGDVLPGV